MFASVKKTFTVLATIALLASPIAAHAATPATPGKPILSSASEANAASDEAQILVTFTSSTTPNLAGHSVRLAAGGVTLDAQATCVNTTCTATFTGLTGGTAYTATVRAIASADGTASAPAVSDQFVALSAPTAPQSRTVANSGANLLLNWTAPVSTGGSPIIEYRITSDGVGFEDATVPSTATSFTATGLTGGEPYTFLISAVNSVGQSAPIAFLAAVAPNVPDAPSAPSASSSGQQVSIEWTAPANGGSQILSYVLALFRGGVLIETVNNVAANLDSYDFVVTTAGDYRATVTARNIVGLGEPSALSQVATVTGGSTLLANLPNLTPNVRQVLAVGGTLAVTADAPSGEPVTLRSSTPLICSFASGVATARAQGSCVITATAAATDTHDQGVRTLEILVKLSQTISFSDIPNQNFPGTLSLSGRATASSGQPIVFTASGSCSMQSALVVVFDSQGSCTVSANIAVSDQFFAASQIQRTFSILGAGGGSIGGGAPAVAPPVQTLRPSLSGTASIGETLVASPGQWQNQANLDFAYRWFRCSSELQNPTKTQVDASCVEITNARLIRYQVGAADSGTHILVEVRAVNAFSLETVSYSNTVFFGSQAAAPGSETPAFWPKKLTDRSLKLYAKNIVGAGKVQFFLNGKEIAWVRAVDESDPKLREANGFYYLVRTVNLRPGMKNVVEIFADGERVRRAAYTVR